MRARHHYLDPSGGVLLTAAWGTNCQVHLAARPALLAPDPSANHAAPQKINKTPRSFGSSGTMTRLETSRWGRNKNQCGSTHKQLSIGSPKLPGITIRNMARYFKAVWLPPLAFSHLAVVQMSKYLDRILLTFCEASSSLSLARVCLSL